MSDLKSQIAENQENFDVLADGLSSEKNRTEMVMPIDSAEHKTNNQSSGLGLRGFLRENSGGSVRDDYHNVRGNSLNGRTN